MRIEPGDAEVSESALIRASSPALSPSCPREPVIPPEKTRRPDGEKPKHCPDVRPKRAASFPPASRNARTPGIAAADVHRSVFSQPGGIPAGTVNSTTASVLSEHAAITRANSAILARVQGQCGCASITRMFRAGSCGTALFRGHCDGGATATAAGVFS